jgi:hypothetical protein
MPEPLRAVDADGFPEAPMTHEEPRHFAWRGREGVWQITATGKQGNIETFSARTTDGVLVAEMLDFLTGDEPDARVQAERRLR